MFVRWQSRVQTLRGSGSTLHSAILCRSVRINGKPRQKHVAYLGGVVTTTKEPTGSVIFRWHFWQDVGRKLRALKLSADDRRKVEAALASRVKRPTKIQFEKAKHATDRQTAEFIKSINRDLAEARQ